MVIIKRYPNRKLYDTEAKQYITLDGVADLIRGGGEVTVIDHTSGEDLTALTLTQIIVEQEKKRSGVLPHSILAGLIQASGDRLQALQKTLVTPFSFLRQFDEEIKQRIQDLVKKGELSEREGQKVLEKILSQISLTNKEQSADDVEIERILVEKGTPTRSDLQQLMDQLESISSKLDQLINQKS
jgi:polyhydroxyalkanoate synthesis repressor PhaR